MKISEKLLSDTSKRPWKIPSGNWSYYQEWNNALFLHWKVSPEELKEHTPANLDIDFYNGECWISLVAFTMERIRPRNMPSVSAISNFHEINIRTYLTTEDKPGVYFLNIKAGKRLSSFIAIKLSGLKYQFSKLKRDDNGDIKYVSIKNVKGFEFEIGYKIGHIIRNKTDLDRWLTERYCLYFDKNEKNYRYDIHHKPWDLYEVEIDNFVIEYKIGNILLNRKPDLMHYSKGVEVISWNKEIISK